MSVLIKAGLLGQWWKQDSLICWIYINILKRVRVSHPDWLFLILFSFLFRWLVIVLFVLFFSFRRHVWRRRVTMRRCSSRCFAVWGAGSTWESSTVTSWPVTSCSWSSSKSWWDSHFIVLYWSDRFTGMSTSYVHTGQEASVVYNCFI